MVVVMSLRISCLAGLRHIPYLVCGKIRARLQKGAVEALACMTRCVVMSCLFSKWDKCLHILTPPVKIFTCLSTSIMTLAL